MTYWNIPKNNSVKNQEWITSQ